MEVRLEIKRKMQTSNRNISVCTQRWEQNPGLTDKREYVTHTQWIQRHIAGTQMLTLSYKISHMSLINMLIKLKETMPKEQLMLNICFSEVLIETSDKIYMDFIRTIN